MTIDLNQIDYRIGIIVNNCTPIKLLHKDRSHRTYLFTCGHCGNEFSALFNNVRKGNTKSCGCQKYKNRPKTHGLSEHKIYNVWRGMISRCNWPKHISYKNYGGRGISVCKRWLKFENFLSDMGIPKGKMDIDRINNDGNYTAKNCRWVSRKQNSRKKRNSIIIEVFGSKLNLVEAAEKFKINEVCLRKRIERGWKPEQAVKIPSGSSR